MDVDKRKDLLKYTQKRKQHRLINANFHLQNILIIKSSYL